MPLRAKGEKSLAESFGAEVMIRRGGDMLWTYRAPLLGMNGDGNTAYIYLIFAGCCICARSWIAARMRADIGDALAALPLCSLVPCGIDSQSSRCRYLARGVAWHVMQLLYLLVLIRWTAKLPQLVCNMSTKFKLRSPYNQQWSARVLTLISSSFFFLLLFSLFLCTRLNLGGGHSHF